MNTQISQTQNENITSKTINTPVLQYLSGHLLMTPPEEMFANCLLSYQYGYMVSRKGNDLQVYRTK